MTTSQQPTERSVEASAHGAPTREHITVTPTQVAAARLQIALDRRLRRKTPKIIKLIAAAK